MKRHLVLPNIGGHIGDVDVPRSLGVAFLYDVSGEGGASVALRRVPLDHDVVTVLVLGPHISGRFWLVCKD